MAIRKLYVQTGIELISSSHKDTEQEVKDTVAMIGDKHINPDGDVTKVTSVRIVDLRTGKRLCNEGEFH